MKRIALLIFVNLAIMTMLGIALTVAQMYFGARIPGGASYLLFAAVFGFGGAFISLWMSRPIARWTTGARVIEQPANKQQAWLVQTVHRIAQQAGIAMPQVAIYPSPEINAFATGPSRNKSMVAVSEGLLVGMSRAEAEGVLAHEVAHVANGDMVTMTLLQGTLNTLVLVAARAVGLFVDRAILRNESGHGIGFFVANIAAQMVLGLLASLIVMAFSRHREYRADAGGARLAGTSKMVAGLKRLQSLTEGQPSDLPDGVKAFGIRGGGASWFSSHPPLADRIRALEQAPSNIVV